MFDPAFDHTDIFLPVCRYTEPIEKPVDAVRGRKALFGAG
jgi:hypothetical protein